MDVVTPPVAVEAPPNVEVTSAPSVTGADPAMTMDHDMPAMTGLFGGYAMNRDASGTSWQPDVTPHNGLHATRGHWSLMSHASINGVYDWQGGPRGDEDVFLSGMVMGAARRDFANGDTLNLRVMASPDAFMGRSGYPLLLASGETADGAEHLVDRQHPHDLFMEWSASYAHGLSESDSVFVYAGLPGEPAFGPPAFMHRLTGMDSPEAPISHHYLDSTHITFGMLTAGWVHDNWRIEASGFRGREPDQDRFDIESPRIDSAALRISWNPTPHWSLQASWADVQSPEQLEPDIDETRWSTSAIYTSPLNGGGWWSLTAAFGRKERSDGESLDAWLAEGALHPSDAWTLFARAERIETGELNFGADRIDTVGRVSVGAVHDWRIAQHVAFGVGALYSHGFVPDALSPSYDGDPNGAMAFVRLRIE